MVRKIIYTLVILIALCLSAQIVCSSAAEAEDEIAVTAKAYVGNAYSENGDRCSPFGTLILSGVRRTDESNVFCAEDSVSMAFRYNVNLLPAGLRDDEEMVVCGDIGASVRRGTVVVEKRLTGEKEWETVFAASGVFETHPEGIEDLYSVSFKDLFLGCQFRLTLAYRCGHQRYLQRYELELLPMNYVAMVHDLDSTEELAFLTDNSSTIQGFELVFLAEDEEITVSYNGGKKKVYKSAVSFTEPGEYHVKHELWGRTATCTVYVLPAEKELFENLFGGTMISESTRVFTTDELPCYNKVALISFNELKHLPSVTGKAENLTTDETRFFDVKEGTVAVSGEGEWRITVAVGESGSFYEFSATVKILDEGPHQSVNEWMLQLCEDLGHYAFVKVPYQNDQAILARSVHGVYWIVHEIPLREQLPEGEYIIEEYTANQLTYSYPLSYVRSCADASAEETLAKADQPIIPMHADGAELHAHTSAKKSSSMVVLLTVATIVSLAAAVLVTVIKKRNHPCERRKSGGKK